MPAVQSNHLVPLSPSGVFMGLGLSGIVPTMHFTIEEGFVKATTVGQMGWFYLMGAMYITGAGLYAARIPERYFPGKCDIWVSTSSFQISFQLEPPRDKQAFDIQ